MPREIPVGGVRMDAVPEQYRDIVAQSAQQAGVSEQLLRNILQWEHQYVHDPETTTGASGVRGIAQIRDNTATRYGINNRDANSSILGMGTLLRRFANPAEAVIAYNAGDTGFQRWANGQIMSGRNAGQPDPNNVGGRNFAALPRETQRYLEQVLQGIEPGQWGGTFSGGLDDSGMPFGWGQEGGPEALGPETGTAVIGGTLNGFDLEETDGGWMQHLNPGWQPGQGITSDMWGTPSWGDPAPAPAPTGSVPGIGPDLERALRNLGMWPPGGGGGITHFPGSGPYGGGTTTNTPVPWPTPSPAPPPNPIDTFAPGSPPINPFPSGGPGSGGSPFAPGGGGPGGPGGGGPLPEIIVTPFNRQAQPGTQFNNQPLKPELGKKDSRGGVVPMMFAKGGGIANALRYANSLAMGGAPVMVRPYVRRTGPKGGMSGGMGGMGQGLINSSVPGRTDKIPMNVKGGSYVLPADTVSGVGENNTLAGGKKLDKIFGQGPYQSGPPPSLNRKAPSFMPQKSSRMIRQRFADGGNSKTPIIVAGGEYLIHADTVARIGGGDPERGFAILDAFVKEVRDHHRKTLKKLPSPKR